jgi:hypothetical protein
VNHPRRGDRRSQQPRPLTFGACLSRISDSRLSTRASGDSNLNSSMPSTVDLCGGLALRLAIGHPRPRLAATCERIGKQFGNQRRRQAGLLVHALRARETVVRRRQDRCAGCVLIISASGPGTHGRMLRTGDSALSSGPPTPGSTRTGSGASDIARLRRLHPASLDKQNDELGPGRTRVLAIRSP